MKASTIVGLLLISSGLLILVYSFVSNYLLHWLVAALIFSSGILFIAESRNTILSIFVCGECERRFLNESDLKKHYTKEHINKDSNEKKD